MADNTLPTSPVSQEPSITAGTVGAVAAALIGLLVVFGVPLSDDQQKAILVAVAVIAPIVISLVVRSAVVPRANVVEYVPRRVASQPNPDVVAGEANDLVGSGTVVRQLSDD